MWSRKSAEQYLKKTATKGIIPGLEGMKQVLEGLGNPQDKLQFVQIAGTNGKGSVVAYVSRVLAQAGYRTGRYTSPAVFSAEETIQIGEGGQWEPVSGKQYVEGVKALRRVLKDLAAKQQTMPTQFELETALAFWLFARNGCQIAVIETGMGGDLDATNVVQTTVCSGLVSISLDHQKFLGDTLEEIALHKAGIIKPGRPAVLMGQDPRVEETVRMVCRQQNSPLYITDRSQATIEASNIDGQTFVVPEFGRIHISLLGSFQIDNALVALEIIRRLQAAGYEITKEQVQRGIAETVWPGRMQVLQKSPLVLLDGAHNPDAAKKLRETLEKDFTNTKFVYIMGVLADKDYKGVLQILCDTAITFVTLTPHNDRALSSEQLADAVLELDRKIPVMVVDTVKESMEYCRLFVANGASVIFCGSLSFLGEVERQWNKKKRK